MSKEYAIAKTGERIVMGKVMNLRLRALAFHNFHLQRLIGAHQVGCTLGNPLLKLFINLLQSLVGAGDLLLGSPDLQLVSDSRQPAGKSIGFVT